MSYKDIELAQANLEDEQKSFLRKWGWRETCNTPGSYWLWVRDFADVDAKRAAWDKEHHAGEPGKPSKSVPYGIIATDTDLAVKMTIHCPWLGVVETEGPPKEEDGE